MPHFDTGSGSMVWYWQQVHSAHIHLTLHRRLNWYATKEASRGIKGLGGSRQWIHL